MSRWKLAQDYEKNWWLDQSNKIDLTFYKNFAKEITELLKPFIKIDQNTKILEIGSGAAGIITHLNSNKRYAIDPLEKFYSTIPKYKNYRDREVSYFAAEGEHLPFKNEFFDLIIMDNVLDHCSKPNQVLLEVKRVLKQNGIFYFRQNTYHLWGRFIRAIMEIFLIDKGHPHTFSKNSLHKILQNLGFEILYRKSDGYLSTWLWEVKSNRIIDKIKAVLFVNRDKYTLILRKIS
ncbi:MAG: class I SAM-dependent methyltransferase [Ignavibacterium sp.]|nr:class I SAM-dependent methyltransferase [Ignavibacterium sp.]MCX7610091.1 class I SAM-dependent methyltransferase [Ignavibacterium sp.]MDW8374284.1 class I SAM-dependent methyltransferase [Ignavibacteriales bacterium]